MAGSSVIRDELTVGQFVQDQYNAFSGPGPFLVLGRVVKHAPGFVLRVTAGKPLIVVADLYDSNDGMIDAKGTLGPPGAPGLPGEPSHSIGGVPGPAGGGSKGGDGGVGGPGGTVTLLAREITKANISVVGGSGGFGGVGGRGGRGGDGFPETPGDDQGNPGDPGIPGASGGMGGPGGNGGPGGPAGTLTLISVTGGENAFLDTSGGNNGQPGRGGPAGPDGRNSEPVCPPEDPFCTGPDGEFGPGGPASAPNEAVVTPEEFPVHVRAMLGDSAAAWATYRVRVGEYFYRRYNQAIAAQVKFGGMAATEFAAALQLQPGHSDALRWQSQLVGAEQVDPATGDTRLVGGGNNALGLPRDLDILPDFTNQIAAFARFSDLTLNFLLISSQSLLAVEEVEILLKFANDRQRDATALVAASTADVALSRTEQDIAGEELEQLQKRLDDITAQIRAARPMTEHKAFTFGGALGTVAAIGSAVVAVIAAIPSAGTSLVALIPSFLALSKSISDNGEAIVRKVLAEGDELKAVKKAYGELGKNVNTVVTASQSVVDLVKVLQRLDAGTTPANAPDVALIKRALEQAHEVLIARHRVSLAGQRTTALEARLERAQQMLENAKQSAKSIDRTAESIHRVGLLAIDAARAKVDLLLELAFRAQRSLEIFTLQSQEANLALDAGHLHPDLEDDYRDKQLSHARLLQELTAAWQLLLNPTVMQRDFINFLDSGLDQDVLRLSFADPGSLDAMRTSKRLAFRLDVGALPRDRFDTKIAGVAVALVGATSTSGAVSCEIRHGGRYEQRRRNGTVTVQQLQARRSTRTSATRPLDVSNVDLQSSPPTSLQPTFAFWGRGVGGEWEVSIVAGESATVDLAQLTAVQVWIGYQFLH